jgi:hypothetical protein
MTRIPRDLRGRDFVKALVTRPFVRTEATWC